MKRSRFAQHSARHGGMRGLRGLPGLVSGMGLCMALSGCLGAESQGGFGFLTPKSEPAASTQKASPARPPKAVPLKSVALANGKVVVKAPGGYCVDGGSVKRGVTGGFALLAACGNLQGKAADGAVDPVVMTVQVQPGLFRRDLPSAAAMAEALEPAKALQKIDGDGLTLVHMGTGGDRGLPRGDPKHWRATMLINGYLVGLAPNIGAQPC